MNPRSLRPAIAAAVVVGALAAPFPGSAQDSQDTVVRELVIVAPANGPAWWKVSKGDASVWILGLQGTTPQDLKWDQSTLKRRLKGARLLLGVYNEVAQFDQDAEYPPLPPDLEAEVAALSAKLRPRERPRPDGGRGADRSPPRALDAQVPLRTTAAFGGAGSQLVSRPRPRRDGPPTALDLMPLRNMYAVEAKLGFNLLPEINAIARRAKVPIVTPPVQAFTWEPAAFAPDDPTAKRCLRAVIDELQTPPDNYREAAALWAKGDVIGVLETTPPSIEPECAYLWPGHAERTIAFQTALIAQALDRPGKVVAVAMIGHLVRKDGILERLRAQGFTIHDPSKPLED